MIVRFFKTGISNGESPVRYVLSNVDSLSRQRHESPEILLGGDAKLTIDLINGISRKFKYASGCIAFRPEEQPTKQDIEKILGQFLSVVSAGLMPEQTNSFFVLHKDKPDSKTGLAGSHVHFILPMVVLSGDQAGNRWNPHPPGQKTIQKMEAFTKVINHENGWEQVKEKPDRIGVDSFWRKVDGKSNARKLNFLAQHIHKGIQSNAIRNREGLIDFLQNELGCTITRKSESYLSIKPPGAVKAIRLKGKLFEAKTDYAREFSTHSPTPRTVSQLTVQQHKEAQAKLGQLVREQAQYQSTTYKKEKTHGRQQGNRTPQFPRRISQGTRQSSRVHNGDNALLHGKSGQAIGSGHRTPEHLHSHVHDIPRNGRPYQEAGRQGQGGVGIGRTNTNHTTRTRPNTTERSIECREIRATDSGQVKEPNREHSSQVTHPNPQSNQQAELLSIATTAEELDEQIRKLCISLNSASYENQAKIQQHINQLVGRKEHLPRPK